MTESATTTPVLTAAADIDVSLIVALRRGARDAGEEAPSLNDFVVKAVGRTLRELPRFNASYVEGRIETYSRVNVGIAVATDDALLVPVVLDAECAWFGDPAFDLAFVLNHLLLKGAWRPQWRDGYGALFVELIDAYRPHVNWESWRAIEGRTASLLPALLLARIDGKSPVEYLTDDAPRARARDFARARIERTPATLRSIVDDWCAERAA